MNFFIGAEIACPWEKELPPGRILEEKERHLTLLFLGKEVISHFPEAPFILGPAGWFHRSLLLAHAAAYQIEWLTGEGELLTYQEKLKGMVPHPDPRPFLSHVTIARTPLDQQGWKQHTPLLPLFLRAIHLYESRGNLHYAPITTQVLLPPFEEQEHTADIAFCVRGMSLEDLYVHAQLALAFRFSPLLKFLSKEKMLSLDEVIIALNRVIAACDQQIGCPFKAVSFHGELEKKGRLLHWEMIVDV